MNEELKQKLRQILLSCYDLDIDEDDVEAKTETIEIYLPPKKEAGKVLEGELADQVKELVHLLHSEAKVV